jgi:hypothetical protein
MSAIDVFGIGNETALLELYTQCIDSLRDHSRIVIFNYPNDLRSPNSSDAEWSSRLMEIRKLNEDAILGNLSNRVNCYAIQTKREFGGWQLRYIGQTDCRRAESNVASHLTPHSQRTNRVFAKCKEAVRGGCEIGLRLIKVEPDTLRFFIQEKALSDLCNDGVLDWNHK